LGRLDAEGDLSIDEFALEKLKLKQLRGHASWRGLRLSKWKNARRNGQVSAAGERTASFERNRYMS